MKQNRKIKKFRNPLMEEYEANYLTKTDFVTRDDKTGHIKPEFHQRISLIVLLAASEKVSIGDYLQNVLKEQFEKYNLEIQSLYLGALNLPV